MANSKPAQLEVIVAEDSEVETMEVAATPAPAAQVASPAVDPTTLPAFKANDQARVKAQNEAKQLAADLEAARRELAARDEKDMSDLEKTQKERDRYKADAEKAEKLRARTELTYKFPHASETFGDEDLPSEAILATLEKKLTITPAASAPEAPAPPNPQRTEPTAPARPKLEQVLASLDETAHNELPDNWFS
jgi:hypothetical protein